MKKLFILTVSILFLSTGSIASADPINTFTRSLKFEGFAFLASNYGIGYAEYYGDGNLPSDLSMEYDWTLSYNFHAEGIKWQADGTRNEIDYDVSRNFDLGQFALGDDGNPVSTGRTFIESLDSYAYSPGIGGYLHSGNWDHGYVLAGLSLPLGSNLEKALVTFNGDVQLTAAAPVPEPATMLLFGTGLIGLAGAKFRSRRKK